MIDDTAVSARVANGVAPDGLPSTPWHARSPEDVASLLKTGTQGLSDDEVLRRRASTGWNELEQTKPPGVLTLLLHQFTSPLIYILVAATVVTLLLGDYVDSAVIAAVLVLNAAIGFTQERKAEQAVHALMRLLSPNARVVRDGREQQVKSREIVPGDVVLLESGVRVPADMRLMSTTALMMDESLLTGESVPVRKRADAEVAEDAPVAERPTLAYAGSVVTSGRGRGYVVATATRTELGSIAEQVRAEGETETPLQQRMTRFAQTIGVAVALASLVAVGVGMLRGESLAAMFTFAVALAVAVVPEGLPVVFTITLALGVNRMARRNAIIRRLPAVETLGSTTVIGSDKTGTLTENRMTVLAIWAGGSVQPLDSPAAVDERRSPGPGLPETPHDRTLWCGVLTNEASIGGRHGEETITGDPTEGALLVSARAAGWDPDTLRARWALVADLPFEPERKYSASLRDGGEGTWVFVKGAPEQVVEMCAHADTAGGPVPIDEAGVHEAAQALASRGLRVLGMAYGRLDGGGPDDTLHHLSGLTFAGLQGLMDPPRPGVREAIASCRHAGIRVVMITGDHAHTAEAISRQLGLGDDAMAVVTGSELTALSDEALDARLGDVATYARVAPDQKLRIVRALRRSGEVVAVTGDGVNDAPALKAADIGIAMGRSGTDVAREASDMVLADDNFVSIVGAVEEGRIAFDNLRKVTFFLVSTGAAAVVMFLTALAVGWPIPMVAAQILWLNLVTNGLQDVALAFEPGEPDVLDRSPRARREGVMSALLWERTAVAGLVMAVGTLALFLWELERSDSLTRAQTVALTTMVLFQVFHVGNCRSDHTSVFRISPFSNPFLFAATAAAVLVHVAALHVPATQFVLRVEPLDLGTWLRLAAVALTIVAAIEAHKLARRPRPRPGGTTPRLEPARPVSPGAGDTRSRPLDPDRGV
jgi:magnesium-transporting ATPase (P-type)